MPNSSKKIYLAPFQGITRQIFRACYAKHFPFVDKIFTPYFAGMSPKSKLAKKNLAELANIKENNISIIPQILSKDSAEIIYFAEMIEQFGFNELNWNLGCPFPQVANKKRGSGLLPYPEIIDNILNQVFKNINIQFSIKCRLGYHADNEIDKLINVFNNYPIKEIIIHARTGTQLYGGDVNIEKFCEIQPEFKIPLVYNGDIFSESDFIAVDKRCKIDTYMIGRGILSNPFLPAIIKNEDLPSNMNLKIQKFLEELYLAYRKATNDNLSTLGSMKEMWKYLSESFAEPQKIIRKIKKVNSFDEYEDVFANIIKSELIIGKK